MELTQFDIFIVKAIKVIVVLYLIVGVVLVLVTMEGG